MMTTLMMAIVVPPGREEADFDHDLTMMIIMIMMIMKMTTLMMTIVLDHDHIMVMFMMLRTMMMRLLIILEKLVGIEWRYFYCSSDFIDHLILFRPDHHLDLDNIHLIKICHWLYRHARQCLKTRSSSK